MRKLVLLAPALLAACATTPTEQVAAKCSNADAAAFIGQPGNSDTGAAIMKATHSGTLRWAWPNSALTMDFREDRVTVTLGSDGKVAKIDCG